MRHGVQSKEGVVIHVKVQATDEGWYGLQPKYSMTVALQRTDHLTLGQRLSMLSLLYHYYVTCNI